MPFTRLAIAVHRWLGVALCLIFLLWFVSGIAMMYCEFPGVTAEDRFAHAPAIAAAAVRVPPGAAFAALRASAAPDRVRLELLDGRPVYRFETGAVTRAVYADTGDGVAPMSQAAALRAAAAWTGERADEARVTELRDVDQWTVEGPLRSLLPMWTCAWPDGDVVYLSEATGEVVQATTAASRIEAYLGPIPHWLYFTPLRRRASLWRGVVIGASALGASGAALGLLVGVAMYSPRRTYRSGGVPARVPYRGPKRLHMILGLIFGAGAVTWAASGLLSMDPAGATAPVAAPRLLEAPRLEAFTAAPPALAIGRLADVRALDLVTVSGEPIYVAHLPNGDTRVVLADGRVERAFDRALLVDRLQLASGEAVVDTRVLDRYDAYYLDRHRRLPLPVLAMTLGDAARTRYYVDPKTARIVGAYDRHAWVARWLYHGLHSFDLPWLYDHRPLWDVVVIAFMLGGAALATTSIALAWRVVGRAVLPSGARAA